MSGRKPRLPRIVKLALTLWLALPLLYHTQLVILGKSEWYDAWWYVALVVGTIVVVRSLLVFMSGQPPTHTTHHHTT